MDSPQQTAVEAFSSPSEPDPEAARAPAKPLAAAAAPGVFAGWEDELHAQDAQRGSAGASTSVPQNLKRRIIIYSRPMSSAQTATTTPTPSDPRAAAGKAVAPARGPA